MDYVIRYPAVTVPFLLIGHGEQGVKKVHIVVPHRNGLVLHCGIYAELKLLSLVCISECLQVAEEYAELHVKGCGQRP